MSQKTVKDPLIKKQSRMVHFGLLAASFSDSGRKGAAFSCYPD